MNRLQRICSIAPDIRVMGVVVYLLALCVTGYLIAHWKISELGLIVLATAALGILIRPRLGLYLFIASLFLPIRFLNRFFFEVPNIFRWLPHLVLLVTTTIFVFKSKWSKDVTATVFLPQHLRIFALFLAVLSILSAIYNRSSPLVTALGLRYWLLLLGAIMLFGIALPSLRIRTGMLKLILGAGLLQFPVTIFQRFFVLPRVKWAGSVGDLVSGTFGGYPDLLFLQIFCILAVVIWWLKGQRLLRLPPELTLILLIVPLVLSNAKAAWLYLPLCLLFLMRKHFLSPSRQFMRVLVVIVVLILVGALGFELVFKAWYGQNRSPIGFLTNVDAIVEYFFAFEKDPSRPRSFARGEAILFNYSLINDDTVTLFIGLGAGNLSESQIQSGRFVGTSLAPRSGTDITQLAVLLGELGIAGIVLVTWFLFSLYRDSPSIEGCDKWVELRKATIWWNVLLLPYYRVLGSLIVITVVGLVFAPVVTVTSHDEYGWRVIGGEE